MSVCPRTGQPCSIPKQFNVTEITPQGMKQIQCCQNCLSNQPGLTPVPLQPGMLPVLPNPVANMQQMMQKLMAQTQTRQAPQKCTGCQSNSAEIEKIGRFGCPLCYETFHDDIEPMLMQHHGDAKHVGKIPKAWKARQEAGPPRVSTVDRTIETIKRHKQIPLEERINMLEEKMAKYAKAEDYQRAAIIRDVTRRLRVFSARSEASGTSLAA